MCMDTDPHSGNSSVACAIGQIVNLLLTNFPSKISFFKKLVEVPMKKLLKIQYLPHNQ